MPSAVSPIIPPGNLWDDLRQRPYAWKQCGKSFIGDCQPGKHEALSTNPSPTNGKKITGCRFAKDQAGPEVCKKLYWEGNKRAASDAFGSLQPLLPTVPCVMLHLAQCSSHRESLFTNCIIGRDDMTVIRHVICTSRDIPISQLNTLRRISSEISIR
jgi:hypothetical protein